MYTAPGAPAVAATVGPEIVTLEKFLRLGRSEGVSVAVALSLDQPPTGSVNT